MAIELNERFYQGIEIGKLNKELYQTFSELLSIISNTSYLFFYFKKVRGPF